MATKEERRLAAIMFTDIVGYSALSQKDEAFALELLEEHRRLLRPFFARHRGTEIKTIGDAFLIEFSSAVEAVRCAIEIQKRLQKQNAMASAKRKIQVRIGIHIGDVVHREGDIYGDGVNIASRINPLAEPGGICITDQVYIQVRNKVRTAIVNIGQHKLKNIETPLDIYKVVLPWQEKDVDLKPETRVKALPRKKKQWLYFISAMLFFLIIIIGLIIPKLKFQLAPGPSKGTKSIAVLPFKNLSDNKEDEYFSDGITEDIITQLSKISDLTVISRTSIMKYKSSRQSLREIAQELNVSIILEGSVRRVGGRVRIVGQLIDTRRDRHLWAETYDRLLTDILEIQSEVAKQIASELKAKLSPDEKTRIEKKATQNIEAYAYYLRGRDYYHRYTKEDNERAVELFTKALELDPNYALAYAGLGDAYSMRWINYGYSREWLDKALEMSHKAISIDPNLAEGYKALGLAQELMGHVREGLKSYYRAVELNPNYAPVAANIGGINFRLGKYDEALKWMRKAAELQPGSSRFYALVGLQYFYLHSDKLATAWLKRALDFQPEDSFPQLVLADIDLFSGKIRQAREKVQKVLSAHPEETNALNLAGDVELLAGDFRQARVYYEQLAKLTSFLGPPGNKLAYVLLKLGDRERAEKILEENLAHYLENPARDEEGSPLSFYAAEVCAIKDKKQEALSWLHKAVTLGYSDRWIFIDPLLDNIRKEKEFKSIMAEIQNRIDRMRQRIKDLGLDRA